MTDEQAREHPHDLICTQAAMTAHNDRMSDVWLVNRLTVKHREPGWPGTPPGYGDLLACHAELTGASEREPVSV